MGSSAKKKKEKKKDFQKSKLKVGKAKPKASNFTDTSFKSKAIVVTQQSLSQHAPDQAELFKHNLSLAANSRSDHQRRDALAFLTGQLLAKPPNNPVGVPGVLNKLLPLISDASAPARAQLMKLFRAMPAPDVRPVADRIILYVRTGMTNLSSDIRDDSLNVMEWLLDMAGEEVVSCPGGWMKTLNCFSAMMGWNALVAATASEKGTKGWTSGPKSTLGGLKGAQSYPRQLLLLAKFLHVGFKPERPEPYNPRAYWASLYGVPNMSNPFGYLNLFGSPRDEDWEVYADREDRRRVFSRKWHALVVKGTDEAKREGGAVGRAAATLDQVLKDGLRDYEGATGE